MTCIHVMPYLGMVLTEVDDDKENCEDDEVLRTQTVSEFVCKMIRCGPLTGMYNMYGGTMF